MELACSSVFLKHPTLSNIITKRKKKPKNHKRFQHMLNVALLLMLTEDNFFFLFFRHMGANRLPCASHYTGTNPTMFLVLFLSPLSMLLFQPQWATELSGNHRTFASARGEQRTPYKSSSDLQGAQTTCYCGWNLRITSSSKWCFWHFFETAAPL